MFHAPDENDHGLPHDPFTSICAAARERHRMRIPVLVVALLACLAATPASAELLRVGKSPGSLFAYVPLDVGVAQGMFEKRGLQIEIVAFEGAAKMDLALAAEAIDVACGSPMEMSVAARGLPATAIAMIAGPNRELAILLPANSPIKTLDDLRGKSVGIATAASITEWAALELTRVKGWGKDGITRIAVGAGTQAHIAALRTGLVDASVANVMTGVVMEKQKIGRRLAQVSDYAGPFITHEISATNKTLRENPDALRRLLAGWFEAVAFMRANKAETVRIARSATGLKQDEEELEYDLIMPEVSTDGRHPEDMQRIGQSFVDLGILDTVPDMSKLYTEEFLPKR
jgi:NitT/TauT family transport system substrate-binding protein